MSRFLLLQIRDGDDPMREQEVRCFARTLGCGTAQIETADLLAGPPAPETLAAARLLLIGGSGDYSVLDDAPWLEATFELLRRIVREGRPLFASCWGFQALARACGGEVVHESARAELGSVWMELTVAGRQDSLFSMLPDTFRGQSGHEDSVVALPPEAVLLAKTDKAFQALRFRDKPIYGTQFHPELDRDALLERIIRYPVYIKRILGITVEQFAAQLTETTEANAVLRRFGEQTR